MSALWRAALLLSGIVFTIESYANRTHSRWLPLVFAVLSYAYLVLYCKEGESK